MAFSSKIHRSCSSLSTTTTIPININISPLDCKVSLRRDEWWTHRRERKGGGQDIGRKRDGTWPTIVLLFFFSPSATMNDDARGRSGWVTTVGKRWETESNDGNIEHQTKTKPRRLETGDINTKKVVSSRV
jgi:hypothetical protein